MKFKLTYLICMILCVFLTFSTVNATDLSTDIDSNFSEDYNLNSVVNSSQSESSFIKINRNLENNVRNLNNVNVEDDDCVDSMNELSNLNPISDLNSNLNSNLNGNLDSNLNGNLDDLNSISSDEKSLKDTLTKGTFEDVQILINNAKSGDIINLNGGYFTSIGNLIKINKSITIDGGINKATFDAKNLSTIFVVYGVNVKLINCNFINSNNRSVIFYGSDGSVINCSFLNNSCLSNCAHLQVNLNASNFLLENSSFINGNAIRSSNIALTAQNVTVKNCIFINNSVINDDGFQVCGAALLIGLSAADLNIGQIINCTFINNIAISSYAGTHGGALCFRPGIKLYNSTFISNYCNNVGGATTLHTNGELFNCIFINNSAGVYGGAISTGFDRDNISVNISSCIFENNSAPMGGAIQVKGNDIKILNSKFFSNKANVSDGGALFIMGDRTLIINSSFVNNFANNVGAGVLINGSNVTVLNSSFDKNSADFGAAIYVVGDNTNLFNSNFTNHNVVNGSVYIKGINTLGYENYFNNNLGESGVALFILGPNSTLISNNFTSNNASVKGGAVYIFGSNSSIIKSNFFNNNAIPNVSNIDDGLGGAIYIKGNNNSFDSSLFKFNTARNGSAIYTDGINTVLRDCEFDKNQAWSYILNVSINPCISYFNSSDILIDIVLEGGNNIANAIYNTASVNDIYFYNVSYVSSKGLKTTNDDEIHPVNSAENSQNGLLLYQDNREDNQLVNVIILKDNLDLSNSIYDSLTLNKTFSTGIYGDINFNLNSFIGGCLEPGNYSVYAKHYEDDYYKEIDAKNSFEIVPIVDLAINISSNYTDKVNPNDVVVYTIEVINLGPNNATGVIVDNILPDGLEIISFQPSNGDYDDLTNIWDIDTLNSNETAYLLISTKLNNTGFLDYSANVSSNEEDINKSNNFDNCSIFVFACDLSISICPDLEEAHNGDIINWIISIKNNGPDKAYGVNMSIEDMYKLGLLLLLNHSVNSNSSSANDIRVSIDGSEFYIEELDVNDCIEFIFKTKLNTTNKNVLVPVNVTSDTFDLVYENNFDNASTIVLDECDLVITIIADKKEVYEGDEVNWIIKVVNEGRDKAIDVNVHSFWPDGLEFISYDSDKGQLEAPSKESILSGDKIIWNIGELDTNETAILAMVTNALKVGPILKEVNVVSLSYDSNTSNNYDSDSIVVKKYDSDDSDDNANLNPDESSDNGFDVIDLTDDSDNSDNFSNDKNVINHNKEDSNNHKSNSYKNIPMKKTGNPFILLILSLFLVLSKKRRF